MKHEIRNFTINPTEDLLKKGFMKKFNFKFERETWQFYLYGADSSVLDQEEIKFISKILDYLNKEFKGGFIDIK